MVVVTETLDAPTSGKPRRRKLDRGLLIASFAIACGLVLVIFGLFIAETGDEGVDRPEEIESVQPVEDAVQVLRQERVVVDLEAGLEARLVIDGIELPTVQLGQADIDPTAAPGQQIDLPPAAVFDPGNAVISFQPIEGAPIKSFSQGLHEVQVIYWNIEDGPNRARSYIWSFNVI
jgi:hypothetical protein